MQYAEVSLTLDELEQAELRTPCHYKISYKDVIFDFLINLKPDSDSAIVFGTGVVHREKNIFPVFARHSWKDEFNCTTIWYSDPTLKLNQTLGLAWCYGEYNHWYLESIAYILKNLLRKLKISTNKTLFFGSSGGGYTSILLASMFHSAVTAINPQLYCMNCSKSTITLFTDTVLRDGKPLINERVDALALIEREKCFPRMHIIQNIVATRDIEYQLTPFLTALSLSGMDCVDRLSISVYYDKAGHNGMPTKEDTIRYITQDLSVITKNKEMNISLSSVVESVEYTLTSQELFCKLNCQDNLPTGVEFAFYLMHENEIIGRVYFRPETEIAFPRPTLGVYQLKYYIKHENKIQSFYAPLFQISE